MVRTDGQQQAEAADGQRVEAADGQRVEAADGQRAEAPNKRPAEAADEQPAEASNEIKEFQDLQSIGASEACWRLFQFEMSSRSPAVEPLQIHLENHQLVYFQDGQERQAADAEPKDTALTGWKRYNRESAAADPDCLQYRYPDFPRHCRWDKGRRRWVKRQNHQSAPTIGRVVSVSPRQGGVFYLRMLLHHVPGATSFAELRTVAGVVCATNKEACRLRGLLQDDGEWDETLREVTLTQMPTQLRELFTVILVFCQPSGSVRAPPAGTR